MEDGSIKNIKSLEIGDKVQTLDNNGKLTTTDVIMMMDVSDQESNYLIKFYVLLLEFLLMNTFFSSVFKHNNKHK